VATPKDGNGPRVFVKTLRPDRLGDRRARGRFHREVGIYETLDGLGLPTLIDHNADRFKDGRTPLYLVTELIDGVNLKTYIENLQSPPDSGAVLQATLCGPWSRSIRATAARATRRASLRPA
jgi:serine/threonine protein kinase